MVTRGPPWQTSLMLLTSALTRHCRLQPTEVAGITPHDGTFDFFCGCRMFNAATHTGIYAYLAIN